MHFNLPFLPRRSSPSNPGEEVLSFAMGQVRLFLVSNRRARRYVLRLLPDGTARVTIPRGGTAAEGRRFAERNTAWLEEQLRKQAARPRAVETWKLGTTILFRGEFVPLQPDSLGRDGWISFGDQSLPVADLNSDLRPEVEWHLRRLAAIELPARVWELSEFHRIPVRRVTVRSQRSRWGSCSRSGTISLNWRLVQTPVSVRDYLILHELAHVKEMNHSSRFWGEVARLCPFYGEAESWLKSHSDLLRSRHF